MMRPGGEARPFLDTKIQTEINKKENRFYRFKDRTYYTNVAHKPITGKFYARHDGIDIDDYEPETLAKIQRRAFAIPQDKWDEPQTGNQEYGWHIEPLLKLDRSDRRFCFTKIGCEITRIQALIEQAKAGVKEKPFTGIPFKV